MSVGPAEVRAILDRMGVEYEWIEIDPSFADTAAFCEKYGFPPGQSANTIVVASKRTPRAFVACVVLATSRLDVNNAVKRLMGVNKASFADESDMAVVTGMQLGGVTPFGLPATLPIYIDQRVMEQPWVILGAGGRAAKVKVAPSILPLLPSVQVVTGLALEANL